MYTTAPDITASIATLVNLAIKNLIALENPLHFVGLDLLVDINLTLDQIPCSLAADIAPNQTTVEPWKIRITTMTLWKSAT